MRGDPRFKRHIRALRPEFDLISCSPGAAADGVSQHIPLPDTAAFVARTPKMVSALLTRRYRVAQSESPLFRAVRSKFAGRAGPAFDAVLCSDLETVPLALEIADGRPVVPDLREYYPSQFESDVRWRLLLKPLMIHLARERLPQCAAALTVSPGLVDLYRENFGLETVLVTNAAVGRNPRFRATGETLRLIHSGVANPSREIEVMIAAADGIPHLRLDLVLLRLPHLRGYGERLDRLAEATENVRVAPAVPPAELPAMHDAYDVGLSVFPADSHQLNYTLPNKFFDYLQSGLAIVGGPGRDMSVIIDDYSLGPPVREFTVAALRQVLEGLNAGSVDEWKSSACSAAQVLTASEQGRRLLLTMRRVMDGGGPDHRYSSRMGNRS